MKTNFESDLIKEFENEIPYWAHVKIKAWDRELFVKKTPFIIDHYWVSENSINVFAVIGTERGDYQGISWWDFLRTGKRMKHNHELYQQNPQYYAELKERIPKIYYQTCNGQDWYVAGDGNHRTCIARFDAYKRGSCLLHNVETNSYSFDEDLFRVYEQLEDIIQQRRILSLLSVYTKAKYRHDTPGWCKEGFTVKIRYEDLTKGKEILLDYDAATQLTAELSKPWYRKFF